LLHEIASNSKAEDIYIKPLELGDLRKNRSDDLQAITAAHESGHAVLSTILMKTLPKVVYSVLSESEQQGFIYTSYQ